MKIIKDNYTEPVKPWKTMVKCSQCSSILEIDQDDKIYGSYGIGKYYKFYINCPLCKNEIKILDPPEHMKQNCRHEHVD
jgi:hypothetical protein